MIEMYISKPIHHIIFFFGLIYHHVFYHWGLQVSRLDRRVTLGRKIGFSGLGCFVVTKPFILQIIGVIFTFEIVLLQGSSSATCTEQCCKPQF